MQDNFVIYSVLIGDYDYVIDQRLTNNTSIKQILFTDRKLILNNWEVVVLELFPKLTQVENQRVVKILANKYLHNFEYSLYVDANVYGDIELFDELILKFLNSDELILMKRHPDRDCSYEEALVVLRDCKETIRNVEATIKMYENFKFPKQNGLVENNFILRKHMDLGVIIFMEEWFRLFIKYSNRDQLTFNFVAWKLQFNYTYIDDFLGCSFHVNTRAHKSNQHLRIIMSKSCGFKLKIQALLMLLKIIIHNFLRRLIIIF